MLKGRRWTEFATAKCKVNERSAFGPGLVLLRIKNTSTKDEPRAFPPSYYPDGNSAPYQDEGYRNSEWKRRRDGLTDIDVGRDNVFNRCGVPGTAIFNIVCFAAN